jgi:cell division protein FtsW
MKSFGGVRRSKYEITEDLEGRKHKPDYLILVLVCVLIAFGMIVMYSISPAVSAISGQSSNYYFLRHLVSFAIGLVGMFAVYSIKLPKLKNWSYIIGVLSILSSLVIVVTSGIAFRWIKIAGFSFQPAEMMKFGLIIWLGFFLSAQKKAGEIKLFTKTLRPVLYVLAALAFLVVLLQRDLGSMVVLAGITGLMLFVSSVPMKTLSLVLLAFITLAGIAIVSTPYRRDRFETFLNPERDCLNEGYHACQALITIGSGGLFGLGVGNSVQAYGYLPETPTDSIFAIYAEKFGFIGSVIFLVLVGALLIRMLRISSRTQAWEPRLIMIGIIAWIGIQSSINIGAMLGLLPLKGITLPFVSYGGSSLVFVMLAIGLAMRISCYTSVRKYDLEQRGGENNENTSIGRGNRRTYNAPLGSRR